jgi:hypothetical protein
VLSAARTAEPSVCAAGLITFGGGGTEFVAEEQLSPRNGYPPDLRWPS